jgi:hypothetical protein
MLGPVTARDPLERRKTVFTTLDHWERAVFPADR